MSRDGRPVTDLQPYLGAFGHLVALRSGDLAYLHVHPADDGDAGPGTSASSRPPRPPAPTGCSSTSSTADVVRTAAFTVSAHGEGR